MDVKESVIYFDQENSMYKLDLGVYTRYFDGIFYNNAGVCKYFGNNFLKVDNFRVDSNFIFGFSNFNSNIILNIFSLNDFSNIYRIVKKVSLKSFQFKGFYYYLLIYSDLEDKIGFYTDCFFDDISIKIENNKIIIENNIFNTILFQEDLCFFEFDKTTDVSFEFNNNFQTIDFYYFENLFNKNNDYELFNDLKRIFKIQGNLSFFDLNFYPKFILKTNEGFGITCIKKLLLSLNPHNFLFYSIKSDKILSFLNEFYHIPDLDIKNIDLDFVWPENVFEYDNKFLEFHKKLLIFRYFLFDLKNNLEKINELSLNSGDSYLKFGDARVSINRETLEKTIFLYENKFSEFLNTFSKKIG